MDENVFAVFLGQEAVTFAVIEPLYCTDDTIVNTRFSVSDSEKQNSNSYSEIQYSNSDWFHRVCHVAGDRFAGGHIHHPGSNEDYHIHLVPIPHAAGPD